MESKGIYWYDGSKAPGYQYPKCFVWIVQLKMKYYIFCKQHEELKMYFEKNIQLFKGQGAVVILLW